MGSTKFWVFPAQNTRKTGSLRVTPRLMNLLRQCPLMLFLRSTPYSVCLEKQTKAAWEDTSFSLGHQLTFLWRNPKEMSEKSDLRIENPSHFPTVSDFKLFLYDNPVALYGMSDWTFVRLRLPWNSLDTTTAYIMPFKSGVQSTNRRIRKREKTFDLGPICNP